MVETAKKINSVALYSSKKNQKVSQILRQLDEISSNLGVKVLYPESSSLKNKKGLSDTRVKKEADLVIAIGGDGTLLSCSRRFGLNGPPILGINLGNLGFLNDIAPNDLTNSLLDIVSGKFIIDVRYFLEARTNGILNKEIALNEIVIHSGSIAQLIEFEVYIDDKFVYRQKADGLIINTPTGSTAYALSGNGPIIHPKVNAISLLPMLPHSLNTRPLIINENSKVLVIPHKKGFLSFDSQSNLKLKKDDEILITKTKRRLQLVHPLDHDFFSACRTKLGWSLGVPVKET